MVRPCACTLRPVPVWLSPRRKKTAKRVFLNGMNWFKVRYKRNEYVLFKVETFLCRASKQKIY